MYDEARERGARFRALSELSRKMTASLDLQQVFDYAVQAAVDLLNLALARLWVWQEATGCLRVFASAGDADLLQPARETFSAGEGIMGAVFQSLKTVTLTDPGQDARYAEREWALRMGVRSVAVVPLRLGDRAVGVLSVARRGGGGFRADDIELLTAFAQNVAIAIENARLFRKGRLAVEELLRLRKLSILSEIGSVMQGTMQMDTLLQVVLTGVTYGEGLGFNRAMLLLVDEARQILRGRMGVGPGSGEEAAAVWGALTSAPRPLAEVIAERTARRGDREDSAFDRLARSFRIPLRGAEASWCAPRSRGVRTGSPTPGTIPASIRTGKGGWTWTSSPAPRWSPREEWWASWSWTTSSTASRSRTRTSNSSPPLPRRPA